MQEKSIYQSTRPTKRKKTTLVLSCGMILISAGFLFWSLVSKQNSPSAEINYEAIEAEAEANGMQLVKGNQIAVIRDKIGQETGEKVIFSFVLRNGQVFQEETDKDIEIKVIEGSDTRPVYVDINPNITIYNIDQINSLQESVSQKVSQSLQNKINKNIQTPVIIRFSGVEKPYVKNDDKIVFQNKKAKFTETKKRISPKFKNKSKIKNDLLIINGISATLDLTTLEELKKSPDVAKIEEDVSVQASLDTSLDQIHAKEIWPLFDNNKKSLTGVGEKIAIIDTGVDYTHEDLGGCFGAACKVIGGYDFVNNDANPMDDHGHGTHVAATAAGRGQLSGVAPDAQILAYKVLGSDGSGYASWIIKAIQASADPNEDGDTLDHVDVASMSLGGSGNPDDSMSLAVDNSTTLGVVYTIAAGNSDGVSTILSPGTARSAITVAAACKSTEIGKNSYCSKPIASFSSRGPLIWNGFDLKKPDIAAPGVNICAARYANYGSVTCFDTSHIRISGTSMATPHMAGAAALVSQAYPDSTPADIKNRLKQTASDLGMTYNDQGAGLVDLKAAIPIVGKVKTDPIFWTPETDPTTKYTTLTQTISVTPIVSEIDTLDVEFDMNLAGLDLISDKTKLVVANLTTDTFIATLKVDNDLVKSGLHKGSILLKENGQVKGVVFINLTVKLTLEVQPQGEIDYGIDDPTLSTWTSDIKELKVTNLRKDVSQSINISSSSFASGISYQVDPSSISISADSSATIKSNFIVLNSQVANGLYNGTVTVSNQINLISLNIKFIKYYVLIIQDAYPQTTPYPYFAWIQNHSGSFYYKYWNRSNSLTFYFNNPGTIDIINTYYDQYKNYYVFKENISISKGLTQVQTNFEDANHLVQTIGTDSNNKTHSNLSESNKLLEYIPRGSGFGLAQYCSGCTLSQNYYSTFSENYKVYTIYRDPEDIQPTKTIHYFEEKMIGLSDDVTFTNTPADLSYTNIQLDINRDSGNITPIFYSCVMRSCYSVRRIGLYLTLPLTQTIYTNTKDEYFYHKSDVLKTNCPSDGACPYFYISPYFNPSTNQRQLYFSRNNISGIEQKTIYNGLGPSFWLGKFQNTGQQISLNSYFGRYSYIILRQDYALQEYNEIPFNIYQDGAIIKSASFPKLILSGSSGYYDSYYSTTLAQQGIYEFKIDSIPYQIRGQDMNATVWAKFDTSKTDRNPPAFKRLYFYSDDVRSEVYDSSVSNKIDFELDPVGGTFSNVGVSYSSDGINYVPIQTSSSGNNFTALIPDIPGSGKVTFKIDAEDSSNNALSYTFEMPRGQAEQILINSQKTVDKISAKQGDELTYTITYEVISGQAKQVKIEDPIDLTKVDFVSASGSGSLINSKVVWILGDLSKGAKGNVSFKIKVK